MKRAVRSALLVLTALVGTGLLSAPAAHAIQASGSIILSPAKQLQLAQGEEVEVSVAVVNTSSQTPLPPGPAAPATLTGPITVDLGCTDCGCSQKQAGALTFVAGPNAGCVTKTAAVTSCAASNATTVVINLTAAGVALPNNTTPVAVATIKVKMNADSGPPLGIRAGTGVCALTACIAPDQACVSCSAEGCTFVTPNAAESPPCDCPHVCASKIRFIGDAAKPDFFELHAIILPGAGFDPVGKPFTVSMSNSGGQIFSFTLPAGALVQQGDDSLQYTNNNADVTGGVSKIKLAARDDTPGAFRIDIQGYSANLEPDTTLPTDNPNIISAWDVGGQSWSSGSIVWERKAFGWQLNQFGICQPAVHG